MISEAEARALGFRTPTGTDYISTGDNDISLNARAAGTLGLDAKATAQTARDTVARVLSPVVTDEILAGVTDATGRRTWLEANDVDGGPTTTARQILGAHIGITRADVEDLVVAPTDAAGSLLWTAARATDGGPPEWVIDMLRARLGLDPITPEVTTSPWSALRSSETVDDTGLWAVTPAGRTLITTDDVSGVWSAAGAIHWTGSDGHQRAWTPDRGMLLEHAALTSLTCLGDSLTENGAWRDELATLTGLTLTNMGISGETTTQMRGRYLTAPLTTRQAALIYWGGRNNIDDLATVLADDEAIMAAHAVHTPKRLILSATTTQSETAGTLGHARVERINAHRAARWPSEYVDVRRWLIDEGLTEAGITPTAADTAAVAADTPPPSLMADNTHLNTIGSQALGRYLATVISAKGWA